MRKASKLSKNDLKRVFSNLILCPFHHLMFQSVLKVYTPDYRFVRSSKCPGQHAAVYTTRLKGRRILYSGSMELYHRAPCPHRGKASHKNLKSLWLPPLSFPHPAPPYLGLHLSLCHRAAVRVGAERQRPPTRLLLFLGRLRKEVSTAGWQKGNGCLFVRGCSVRGRDISAGHTS